MTATSVPWRGEDLCHAYLQALGSAGMYVGPPVVSVARTFFDRIGPDGWVAMTLGEQCRLPAKYRRTVGWLIATGWLAVSAEYLVRVPAYLGGIAKWVRPDEYTAFTAMAAELGFGGKSLVQQWSAMAKTAGIHGTAPADVTVEQLLDARGRLLAAMAAPEAYRDGHALSRDFHQASITAFHLGWIDRPLARRSRNRRAERQALWDSVPERLRHTFLGYIDQVRLSLRPSTVESIERALREFVTFLASFDPEVAAVADIRRRHIEGFKLHLARRPSGKGGTLHRHTIAQHLGALRTCFERLSEWDGDDLPRGALVFAGDFPIRDEPLPRFIDDAAASRLLAAARAHPDLFTRLCVEFLARTGMRRGEFMALTVDSVVQIGSSFWLRVPLGKLHNDRYIPLHPQLKALLDEWIAQRPAGLRSDLLFIRNGRPIGETMLEKALTETCEAAGIGRVTAHQLRHTLATQAINRGMSLEAIAALLGHRSMRMTMIYARIADRTVADEYFSVSEKVEALYNAPRQLPSDAEGTEMAKLRREMHQRMLGNGYCARPVELDCHYESICESCTFFVTTIEFKPTLQRQRDDAARKGQVGRQKIFDGLLERIDTQVG
ncbi:MAG: tyrosine-type recombinase/integrase [Acidimicrobiales bacterium]